MAETPQSLGTEVITPSRALELYQGARNDLEREGILNNQIVRLNPLGIAQRESYNAVMALIDDEVDPKAPKYMSNVVSDLAGDNLIAVANAHFYNEGPRIAQLSALAERIRSLGSRSQEATRREHPLGLGMEYILREIGERLTDQDLSFVDRRNLVEAIDMDMTPELMEHILTHERELEGILIETQHEFSNPALKEILKRRAKGFEEEAKGEVEEEPEEYISPADK